MMMGYLKEFTWGILLYTHKEYSALNLYALLRVRCHDQINIDIYL